MPTRRKSLGEKLAETNKLTRKLVRNYTKVVKRNRRGQQAITERPLRKTKAPRQPEPGSLAHLMREYHGGSGLNLGLVVSIVCESPIKSNGRACCVNDKIEFRLASSTLRTDEFRDTAIAEFKRRGWVFTRNGIRCPECARRPRKPK